MDQKWPNRVLGHPPDTRATSDLAPQEEGPLGGVGVTPGSRVPGVVQL